MFSFKSLLIVVPRCVWAMCCLFRCGVSGVKAFNEVTKYAKQMTASYELIMYNPAPASRSPPITLLWQPWLMWRWMWFWKSLAKTNTRRKHFRLVTARECLSKRHAKHKTYNTQHLQRKGAVQMLPQNNTYFYGIFIETRKTQIEQLTAEWGKTHLRNRNWISKYPKLCEIYNPLKF